MIAVITALLRAPSSLNIGSRSILKQVEDVGRVRVGSKGTRTTVNGG